MKVEPLKSRVDQLVLFKVSYLRCLYNNPRMITKQKTTHITNAKINSLDNERTKERAIHYGRKAGKINVPHILPPIKMAAKCHLPNEVNKKNLNVTSAFN